MLENPCRFMTVYLTPYCSYCGDLIVEEGYKCDTCYNQHIPFFLCKKCAMKVYLYSCIYLIGYSTSTFYSYYYDTTYIRCI